MLDALLDRYNAASGDLRAAAERDIWRQYGSVGTVLALDMTGFTRLTEAHGIVHYLAMIRRMRMAIRQVVERQMGVARRFEADNMLATFDHPRQAIRAAANIDVALAAMNTMTADAADLYVSIGIGHGELLILPDDCWGHQVNLACKLGEDLALPGEILLTGEAWKMAEGDRGIVAEPAAFIASGAALTAWRLRAAPEAPSQTGRAGHFVGAAPD